MRPVKEFFIEEYWDIAYKEGSDNPVLKSGKFNHYKCLKASMRYWYADPMIFKYNNEIYLFLEMFDNKSGHGVIGYSKYSNGVFSKPKAVIRENFHMSYPYVFEKDGNIFMMPETSADGCVQLYKAVAFPDKWEKYEVLLEVKGAVDTVFLNENCLLTSIIENKFDKTTRLERYDIKSKKKFDDFFQASQHTRGAGKIFEYNGKKIRPAQDCSDGVYGLGLVFYEIEESDKAYSEKEFFRISYRDVENIGGRVKGVHTYARIDTMEVIDCKRKRFNPFLSYYINKKKLFNL